VKENRLETMSDLDELAKAAGARNSAESAHLRPASTFSFQLSTISLPGAASPTQPANAQGVAMGLVMAVLLFGLGFGALFTFWPVGVVMLLAALVSPFMGLGSISGPCPYCASNLLAPPIIRADGGITCHACCRRVIVRNKRYYRVG